METKLKACAGDRAKNLDAIANEIQRVLEEAKQTRDKYGREIVISDGYVHSILGYAEQLRIIAEEIREPTKIIVFVAGGNVTSIQCSDKKANAYVADWDNVECDDDAEKEYNELSESARDLFEVY